MSPLGPGLSINIKSRMSDMELFAVSNQTYWVQHACHRKTQRLVALSSQRHEAIIPKHERESMKSDDGDSEHLSRLLIRPVPKKNTQRTK